MKRILGFTGGVIATSVLLSGCVGTKNIEVKQPYTNEHPFLRNIIDGNSSKIHGIALSSAITISGTIRGTQDISTPPPIVIKSTNKEEFKCIFVADVKKYSLVSERLYPELQSASCFDKDGNYYESKNIKGFVADSDGFVGLKGQMVSTMGSMMLRATENLNNIDNNTTKVTNETFLSLEVKPNKEVTVIATEGDFYKIYKGAK